MGLDVSFNRARALEAGLEMVMERNASDESIAQAIAEKDNPEFIQWMQQTVECVRVPGREYLVENGGVDDVIILRANRWGNTYAPLTEWLKTHNIEWDEA